MPQLLHGWEIPQVAWAPRDWCRGAVGCPFHSFWYLYDESVFFFVACCCARGGAAERGCI